MRQENREFYNIAQNNDWVDISKFWSWPTQEILEDIKNIPDKFKPQIESHLTMPEAIGYLNIDIKYPNAFREWINWISR